MARLPRAVIPGVPHHVTQRGVRSMKVFSCDGDYRTYLSLMARQAADHSLVVISWCLMPNHIHLVCVPGREDSLARTVGEAHRRYTRMVNERSGLKGHLFQERFFSCPLDERHFRAAVPYVLNNPVKARMCDLAEEYTWSSARFNLGLANTDPLASKSEHINDLGDIRLLMSRPDRQLDDELRKCTKTGRPCGSDAFVRALELISGRKLSPGKRGRPSRKKS